jgi:hypothetical protein
MDTSVLAEGPEAHPADHENEAKGFLSGWKFIQQLSDCLVNLKFKLQHNYMHHSLPFP